jgi:AraC-like DNA-binding protein
MAGQIELEANKKKAGYIFISTAHFMELIVFLARCYDGEKTPESQALLQIGAAISYLEDHYSETISVKQLTRIAGMSESSLLRAFKRATGHTPTEYLRYLRLHRAQYLLRQTTLNITEIALETGFNDSNYFARAFHKAEGATPSAYRKNSSNKLNDSPLIAQASFPQRRLPG